MSKMSFRIFKGTIPRSTIESNNSESTMNHEPIGNIGGNMSRGSNIHQLVGGKSSVNSKKLELDYVRRRGLEKLTNDEKYALVNKHSLQGQFEEFLRTHLSIKKRVPPSTRGQRQQRKPKKVLRPPTPEPEESDEPVDNIIGGLDYEDPNDEESEDGSDVYDDEYGY